MRRKRLWSICGFALALFTWSAAAAELSPVGEQEEQDWVSRLIPLPKQIVIEWQIALPEGGVRVRTRIGAGEVEKHAAAQLRTLFGEEDRGDFEILVGLLDDRGLCAGFELTEEANRLRGLPNREQAYAIVPVEEDRLIVAALDEPGVWYGAQTLRQLLEWQPRAGKRTVPLARVVDWPDLAQRGLWDDTFSAEQIEFMAAHKLNRIDCHTRLGIGAQGQGTVERLPAQGTPQTDGLDYPSFCRLRGMRYVPIVTHLSHLKRTGIYERYPELKGQGAAAQGKFVAPCAAQPKCAEILADWMSALASRPHVAEIAVWLGEEADQCECAECRAMGQHVMEAKAIATAYRRVAAAHPDLRLWVLLSQGSFPVNDQVLAELPGEVGAIYYHGIKTYDSAREPMVYFGLREEVAQGRKIGICPQLTVSWAVVCPWSSPQFVRFRMNEFADKGLSLVSAYATPDIRLYAFNVAALAEWSWNARGRDERQFALAWARRRGYRDPQAAADWAVALGSVSWNVYGSLIPYHFIPQWGHAARTIENRVRPALGEGMFRYFPTPERFDEDLAVCARVLEIAFRLEEPVLIEETRVVQGYIRMLRAIYWIAESLWRKDAPLPQGALRGYLVELTDAGRRTNAALRRWERLFGEGAGGGRFTGTLEMSEEIVARIGAAVERFTEKDHHSRWR